jgi:regulator of protease activity HflC (stomatin/prohibitin superfamily)
MPPQLEIHHGRGPSPASIVRWVGMGVLALVAVVLAFQSYYTVQAGHVAVATLFGDVVEQPYGEGFHFPVNPLYEWHLYDAREKTHLESAEVPSQDQLSTQIDVSVQYRVNRVMAAHMLRDVGTAEQAKQVHLVPALRSLVREQGKTVKRAEDFFQEQTQARLQTAIFDGLQAYLAPKGIEVTAVLLRDIRLPPFILKAIEQKKEREQAVERQKAELDRFRYEQEQSVARAEAERRAAEEEAARRRVLAEAQAYEIRQINEAISDNPTYLQLQAIEALKAMSKDPAAKLYFIDSDSPNPVPLMHIGDR